MAAFREYILVHGTILPIQTFHLDAMDGVRVEKRHAETGTLVKKSDPDMNLADPNLQLDAMCRVHLIFRSHCSFCA